MLRHYLLTAYKIFLRRKLFTAINLACIVLTLVVLMVVTALLQNAFYPGGAEGRSARFVQVKSLEARRGGSSAVRTTPLGYQLIAQYLKPLAGSGNVEAVAAVTLPETVSVYQRDRVTELTMRRADAEYWTILDFHVLAGRVPDRADVDGGRFVAAINRTSAGKLFPGPVDGAVGRQVNVGGQLFTVIGVVEDELQINSYADLWAPLTTFPSSDYRNEQTGNLVALLMTRSAADIPALKQRIAAVAATVQLADPREWDIAHFWGDGKLDFFARLLLQSEQVDSGAATLLAIIGALMLLFMLLPALNLVNLNVGRIMERSTEIGVRKAFGASTGQLVLQLLLENVVLCLAGGLLGLLCARLALWWLEGSGLVPYLHVEMNLPVFGWGLLLTLVFGLLSGVLPAWKMARLDPVHALKGAA